MTELRGVAGEAGSIRGPVARRITAYSRALLTSTALVAVAPALDPFGFGGAAFAAGGRGGAAPADKEVQIA